MERKVPPAFGGPRVANSADPPPFARRNGPPTAFGAPPTTATNEQNAPPPPQSFGFPGTRAPINTSTGATRRGWKPGRVGGRHDSPLYGKHRKRPSSSSIDSNVSWSGSEIESVGAAASEQEQVSRLSWASSVAARDEAPSAAQQDLAPASSLFGALAVDQSSPPPPVAAAAESRQHETKQSIASDAGVQPPKTPLGKPTVDSDGEISAAQRVRMELSAHAGSRADSRANSSENVFGNPIPPVYDEKKNGPQSCPSTFNNAREPQFSIDKLRQLRSNELVASKLLPTRTSVNSLMGYVRELQLSEATLRKQLVKTKQHTEEELSNSLSKVTELERDRMLARQKLKEQEQMIHDLAAKLKQAEAAKSKASAVPTVDELPPIAEEVSPQIDTDVEPATAEEKEPEGARVLASSPVQIPLPPKRQEQIPMPPVHPDLPKDSKRAQFGLASPRSPNQPLWDPWASGGATPMKNLPPVFTIGSTGLDPVASSSTSASQTSMTESTAMASGEYELKSVLMSPRRVQDQVESSETGNRVQKVGQNESTIPLAEQQEFAHAPAFSVGAMPSPPYPPQEVLVSSQTQNEDYGVQSQEEVSLLQSPSQTMPIPPVSTNDSADKTIFQQQDVNGAPEDHYAADSNGTDWNDQPGAVTPAASLPPHTESGGDTNEGMPTLSSVAGDSTVLPPPETPQTDQNHHGASELPTPYCKSANSSRPEKASDAKTENAVTGISSAPPLGPSNPLPSTTSDAQPPIIASRDQQETKDSPSEPVSLEVLLVDFFTEVDKKRLKMAKVYGKRYAGREKWLFTELTKRYGAAKVAALKAQYESGSGGDTPGATISSVSNGKNDQHAAKSSDTSDHLKAGRQSHPRHPQFFHPPTPISNADLSAGMPSASPTVTASEKIGVSSCQEQHLAADGGNFPSSRGELPETNATVGLSRQRHSGSNNPPSTGSGSSLPASQAPEGRNNDAAVGKNDPPLVRGPPPPIQHEGSVEQFKSPPPPPENSTAAPLGLRQRHNPSGPTAPCQKNHGAELPAVTLEGLLKELYRNHQPDKLKNVSAVAKEYAGKERELVGLLKGKYGALSVKRLEENLEVLERAHHARMGGKGKKRGCFIRTVSLVFWLSVLLYFSFGAVFVSFVVLDAWECRALDSDDPEQESAEECVALKKELEAFTYERVADYISLSHPEACFCSEWKSRENALFTTFSGEDFVNLARLVPFSPESFGAPWIMSVKEQVPSQEFYDSYAKPVVDLSLDVGSFVWSSVLELAGYDEASVEKSPVVEDVLENNAVDNLPVEEEIESDVNSGSLEQSAEEVETDRLVSEEGTDSQLTEDAEVETDALHMAGVLEQPPLEEDTAAFEDDLKMDETETDASAIDDVAEESVAPVEEVSVEEESYPVTSEVKNVVDSEDHATVESIDMLESEDIRAVEEYEPIPDIEEDSVDLVETEVEGAQTEDDSTSGQVEEIKTVDGDDGTASAPVETDVADVAAFDAGKEAPEIAVEESDEHAVEDVAVESEDDVVEIEMRQEGLDLSYSETETEADATEEVLNDGSVDVLLSSPGEENEPALHVDEEVVSTLVEGETEEIDIGVQSEDVSVSTLEGDSEAVVESTEEGMATPSDATEQKSELEPDVSAPSEIFGVEVENAEVELGNVQDVEMEVSPEFREENEPVVESVDGDLEALVLNREDVDEMGAASSLREESMLEVGEDEVDIPSETDPTETLSVEEVNASEEDQGDVLTEEESAEVMEVEVEASPSSIDGDREGILSEESSSSSIEEPVANDSDDVDAVSAASVKVEEPLLENGDVIVDEEGAEVVTNNAEDESAILSDAEAATIELEAEDGIADVLVDDVEERQVVEDIEEAPTASADIEADAVDNEADEQLSSPDTEEEAELHHDDAKLTTLSEIEAEQSASEVDLVSELSEEAVAIEAPATETSVDEDVVSPERAHEFNEQLVEAENSSGSVAQRSIPDAVADRTPEVDDLSVASKPAADTVDASDAISGVGSLAGLPAVEISVVTADVDEDEEIAFMEEFEDPDEVLRMAEQAAAAELSTMESR